MNILGIHPGPRHTGLVLVDFGPLGARLLFHTTVGRDAPVIDPPLPVPLPYLERVFDTAARLKPHLIGVENVAPPSRAALNVASTVATCPEAPTLATSIVAGYCMTFGQLAPVVAVVPDGNGAGPLGTYPEVLVAEDERRNPQWRMKTSTGHAPLRHVRAAYDVARLAQAITSRKAPIAG